MHMKYIHPFKQLSLFLFGFITILTFNLLSSQLVKADNVDLQNALATTPKGLSWENNSFVLADFQAASNNKLKIQSAPINNVINPLLNNSLINNATITQSTNPDPDKKKTSVIQMTNDFRQTGAVWSNMENGNYFDISQDQKASMWLYFGSIDKTTTSVGDGMAFVLHNDKNKENSIALSANGVPVNGQSLGVWGADWDSTNQTHPEYLSNTAIQNSWALEFDTYVNYSRPPSAAGKNDGVAFDDSIEQGYGQRSKHIAGNYPAQPSTYISDGGYPNFFVMDHGKNYKFRQNLVDSKWHHVTITWKRDTKTLTYAYNDKDPNTGLPITNDVVSTSFPLDINKFGLTDGNTKLYWGFTGSTGKFSENNLIAFESIPSFVGADVDAKIYDDTNDSKEINDNYNTVDPNTNIRYKYKLDYKGWARDWNKINATIGIPNHIHFTSGTITYPNSPNDKGPRPIPTELFTNSTDNIKFLLPEGLNKDSRTATIELKGYTEKIASSNLTVPSAHTSFDGDNLITDINTKPFTIRQRLLSLDSSSSDPIKVQENADAIVPSQVKYTNNAAPNYNSMIVHQTLNGQTTTLKNIIDSSGNFDLTLDNSLLNKINTLSYYVTDEYGNTSNTVTRQILVGGTVAFGTVQPNVSFKTTHGSYTDKVVPRLNQWQIDVIDSREKGSQWTVQATASNLLNSKKVPLNGHIFFRDPTGNNHILDKVTTITENTKDTDDTETINITDAWSKNNGILLSMQKGNSADKYSGSIKWSLIDSIKN